MNTLFRAKSRADGAPPCCYCCKAPFKPARAGAKERHRTGCGVNCGKFLQQTHEPNYLNRNLIKKTITQIISISDYSNHLSTKIEIYPLRTKLSGANPGKKIERNAQTFRPMTKST